MDCSTPGFPVLHHLPEFAQTHAIELVMPSNHFILCHPLLLLPSTSPSIRVFSDELALRIRWPKYWNFSFSISPSVNIQGWFRRRREGQLSCALLHNLRLGNLPWGLGFVNHQCAIGDRRNPTVSKKTNCVDLGILQCSKVDKEWRSSPAHPTLGSKEIDFMHHFQRGIPRSMITALSTESTVGESHLYLRQLGKYVVKWIKPLRFYRISHRLSWTVYVNKGDRVYISEVRLQCKGMWWLW